MRYSISCLLLIFIGLFHVETEGSIKHIKGLFDSIFNRGSENKNKFPDCSCSDYMNRNGYGRCQKSNPRQANGLPFCYVNEPSSCSDLQTSKTDRSKKFSAVACVLEKSCEDDLNWRDEKFGDGSDSCSTMTYELCNDYGKYSAEARQACRKACSVCSSGKKNKCKKNECWCVSGGGDSCYGTCDPDECHDKIDCPGNGYWCKDEETNVVPPDNQGNLTPRCTCTTYVSSKGYGNCEREYKNQGAICYVNEPSTCADLRVSKRENGRRYSWEACRNRIYITGPPPDLASPPEPPIRPPLPPLQPPSVRPRPRQEGEECDHISSKICKFNCEPCEAGLECIISRHPSNGPSNGGIQPRSEETVAFCHKATPSPPRNEGEECGPSSNPACNSDCGPCAAGLECVKQGPGDNPIQQRSYQSSSFCQLIKVPTDDFSDIPDLPDEHYCLCGENCVNSDGSQGVCQTDDKTCATNVMPPNCNSRCKQNQFTCHNGECIELMYKCDAEQDCNDGSDEFNCTVKEYEDDIPFDGNGVINPRKNTNEEEGAQLRVNESEDLRDGPSDDEDDSLDGSGSNDSLVFPNDPR